MSEPVFAEAVSVVERPRSMPCGDALDRKIASLALPAIASFLILPITSATDLFWVGRMGEALAVAGQSAANQMYSTLSWFTSTIPTITVPRVSEARAAGNETAVQEAVGEAFALSAALGILAAG
jgi:Na+-driven multidrug efflux pump